MLNPEERAEQALNEWIISCRRNNPTHKIELKDVSNWASKRFEFDPNCPDLDSLNGVFILFCLGSLLSFGGGNYQARATEIRDKYHALMSRKFDVDRYGRTFSEERKKRFMAIDDALCNLFKKYGGNAFLQVWLQNKKEVYRNDLDLAAKNMLYEINGWSYKNNVNKKRVLFTVKSFWVAREMHSNNIWPDFPVKYCCIPDSVVKNVLFKFYGDSKYFEFFGVRHSDKRFKIEAAILMNEKICALVSDNKVDGFFPYDLPIFRYGKLMKTSNKSDCFMT